MQSIFVVLILFVLASNPVGAAGLPVIEIELMDGSRVAVHLAEHELASSPGWTPGEGEIPVSVDQAVAAVKDWIRQRRPDYGEVVFSELVLKQIRGGDNVSYWHYLVRYREVSKDGAPGEKESIAAVLLNGDVVPVTVLPPR